MTRDELLSVAATLSSRSNHDPQDAVRRARELIQAVDDEMGHGSDRTGPAEPVALREPSSITKTDAGNVITTEPVVTTKKKEGR
jgi:hypothetical protein